MGTNTGIGIGIGIPFKNNALGGDRPYLPPELKARLIGVWDNYGKKNTDADRNIIKNKIPNAGGDLEILNAAYKLNSGFGEYKEDFTSWRIYPNIEVTDNVITTNGNFNSTWFIYKHANENEINEMNIKVSGIPEGGIIRYFYIPDETATIPVSYNISEDGVYHLPKSKLSSNRVSVGFTVSSSYDWNNIRIEQLSDFGGAFVTDGVNDMIISQKTLQEMGVTKDFTIVSMIHQISWRGSSSIPLTNYIRPTDNIYVRNQVADIGKTGIYGYVVYDIKNSTVGNSHIVNTILGDKNDYSIYTVGNLSQGKFSVQGYMDGNDNIRETSSVAHYWTFALLGKATEDDINLIIAYFNLDRTLKPDIRCNIERQGITNDNHADFNDKLIDYSGNGRDIQMYNLAWKGGSGIAAKQYETFKDWTSESSSTSIIKQIDEFTRIVESTTNGYWVSRIRRNSDLDKVCSPINVYLYQDNNFLVHECKYEVDGVKYAIPINEPVGKGYHKLEMYTKDRYTELPENAENVVLSEWYFSKSTKGSIKYSIIPSCKGGILLDGINDFGKVIDMPIYKDYTFIIDREIISIGNTAGIVASKSEDSTDVNKQGAFLFEYLGAPNNVSAWSFYKDNGKVANTDFTRGISYQSKYSYNGIELLAGTALDSDKLWLGILRDRDSRFANVAIYSLMSFPYTMSKFLIERQLKKHKLGTLYPNMVEFRPIINSNVKWDTIEIWQASKPLYRPALGTNETGSYIIEDSTIGIYVKPFVGQKVSKIVYNGTSYTDLKANNNGFYYITVPVTKSPQKIGITIEQDENYVLFNPVITSNVEYHRLDFYLNNYQKIINIGDYIPKDAYLRANIYLNNNVDELTAFIFNGVNIGYRRSSVDDTAFNIGHIYNYDSPQEVNITIDEYIRYEDIVQPYPVIFQITDRNTNQRYSWGDKIKVGSSIRLSQGEKPNLLSGLYSIQSYEYEGETYSYNQLTNLNIILTKQSISLSCNKTWLLDDNEPKCILSPRLLRIPNSSYKILGYIPDISGHGNHGVIHNSAYAEMSGANGYRTNLGNWSINSANTGKIITQREEHLEYEVLSADKNILFYNTKIENDTFVIYTSVNTNIVYSKESDIIANIPANTPTKVVCPKIGTILLKTNETPTVGNIITVKQYGIYEGAYCFDGVDDFVIIPTTVGGKQVLMKVNWDDVIANAIIYDQRGYPDEFAIYNADKDNSNNPVFAYQARNTGQTYIDGILNSNIKASELKAITHNITITNELSAGVNKSSPVIGSNIVHNDFFVNMALYDFMLFDNISTDDKIKELNEYVGVEAKVELPPYYWDAYGKTNSDADRDAIQQRGIAVGDYDLTNYNHAYEGMSGYNAYPVVFGIGKTYGGMPSTDDFTYTVSPTTVNVTKFNITHGFIYSYLKHNGELETQNSDYPSYKIKVTGLEKGFGLHYSYLKNPSDANLSAFGIGTDGTYTIPKSFASDGSLINNNVWIGFIFTGTAPESCNVTIEVLPEYENGLAYDGVTDYSKNANIPAFTNYTYIFKRTIINIPTNAATLLKGADKTNGGAFIADYGNKWQFNFGQYNIIQGIADGINWQTVNSFNGTSINKGENTDDSGITVAKFSNGYTSMVFYKLILYPKTISLLEINFLKNLMEKDEIIDLNNPIFIKNE
jgi:hypothetical protein